MLVTGPRRLVLGDRRDVVQHPGAACHRLDLAVALVDDRDLHDWMLRLAQVVDDDVHEPGTQGAVLLGVVRLLVLHRSLLVYRLTDFQISKFPDPPYAATCWRAAASWASAISPASKLVL